MSAGRWDRVKDSLYGPRADLRALPALLDPNWVVGDLGVGTGALAATLAPHVARVVGVDRSPQMLAAAAGRVAEFANVELREGDLERLPVDDGELDVAIMSLVLHHALDPVKVLSEAYRSLSPGGRAVVVDMRAHDRDEYREEMGHLWPGFEPPAVELWMSRAGFRALSVALLAPDPGAEGPLLFLASGSRGGYEGGKLEEQASTDRRLKERC